MVVLALSAPVTVRYSVNQIVGPQGRKIFPTCISANNRIAGVLDSGLLDENDFPIQHAFVWSSNSLTVLPTLGGDNARALGVNSSGDVVGEAQRPDGSYHAFLWRANQMIDLGEVIGDSGASSALGINDAGQVVGTLGPEYFGEAFIWSQGGGLTVLGPGSARGINAAGKVVGAVRDEEGTTYPAVWENGSAVRLPDLGNNLNTITGTFILKNTGDTTARSPKVGFYLANYGDPNSPVANIGVLKTYPSIVKRGTRAMVISVSIPVSQGVDPRGKHGVAVVDPLDAIGEQDETNNTVVFGPLQ